MEWSRVLRRAAPMTLQGFTSFSIVNASLTAVRCVMTGLSQLAEQTRADTLLYTALNWTTARRWSMALQVGVKE